VRPCESRPVRVSILGAILVGVLACENASTRAPVGVGSAGTNDGSALTSGKTADDELYNAWQDALERQVEADAKAGVKMTFASEDDARAYLLSLTPSGFRPRPEFFSALMSKVGDPKIFGERMAVYARQHDDAVTQRLTAFMARLEPVMTQVRANIQRQFPTRR
jgi:hypothetical protein